MKLLLIVFFGVTRVSYANPIADSALIYYQQAVIHEANDFTKAIELYKKVVGLTKDPSLRLESIVRIAFIDGQIKRAFQKDIYELLKTETDYLTINPRWDTVALNIYYYRGLYADNLFEPMEAIASYHRALQVGARMQIQNFKIALCYYGLGETYKYRLYNFDLAEDNLEKSLQILESLPTTNILQIARTYYSLASANRSQRDYERALACAMKTMDLVKPLNHQLFIELTYTLIGSIYRDMKNYSEARKYYNLAIVLNSKVNNNILNETQASNYSNLAVSQMREGLMKEAIVSYEKMVSFYKKIGVRDKVLFLNALNGLATAYREGKQMDKALKTHKEIFRELAKLNMMKSGEACESFRNFGLFYLEQNEIDSALFCFQQSLISGVDNFKSTNYQDNPLPDSVQRSDAIFQTLLFKAKGMRALADQKNETEINKAALHCLKLANHLLAQSRKDLDREDSKWGLMNEHYDVYEAALALLYNMHEVYHADSLIRDVFYFFEQSRSKTLSDALNQAEVSDPKIFKDSLFLQLRESRVSLFNYQSILTSATDELTKQSIRQSMIEDDKKIKRLEDAIDRKYPDYRKTKYQSQAISYDASKKFIQKSGGMVIGYFWGSDHIYALAMSGMGSRFFRISSSDELDKPLSELLALLANAHSSLDQSYFVEFGKTSNQLYEMLLGPLEDWVDKSTHIVVLPDGKLGQLPFELLTRSRYNFDRINYKGLPYLVKTHTLSYAASMAHLKLKPGNVIAEPNLLAMGFTESSSNRDALGNRMQELAGAQLELQSLQTSFSKGLFLIGKGILESTFKAEAGNFDIIHLAVHGKGNTQDNYSASLYFEQDSIDDGELHWYELYGLKLKASLAVLSSCESGIGRTFRGEGMLSMASAFTYAGARNMVIAQWKVNDQVSSQLMKDFYDRIKSGDRVDDALTYAKRQYLEKSDAIIADPRMWGALVVYGIDSVSKKKTNQYFILIGFLALIIAASYLTKKYRL